MSTLTCKQNCIMGLGEGGSLADTTMLAYALRWLNCAYREIFLRYRFKSLQTKSLFRMTHGQATYQAPADFAGFLTLKDETNDTILDQVTPEELQRTITNSSITNESITTNAVTLATALTLAHTGLVQYSEVVTDVAGTTTYTRDIDYTMSYSTGVITPVTAGSGGSMVVATEYYIDYLYYNEGTPTQFCIEYDSVNKAYLFRLDPIPDSNYVASILYPALPSDLSASSEPLWSYLEFALERGGIYYGSLELLDDPQKRSEFKNNYETAMQGLIQLDTELVPKQMTIPLRMRASDHKG